MINGGKGSNRTVERIILESPLVQVYRNIQAMIQQTFEHTHRSTNHAEPEMKKTFEKLLEKLSLDSPHVVINGRRTRHEIIDLHDKGQYMMERAVPQGEGSEGMDVGSENEDAGGAIDSDLRLDDVMADLL